MSEVLVPARETMAERLPGAVPPLLIDRDIELGLWEPTLIGTGAAAGRFRYSVRSGHWFRQGPLIYVACRVTIAATLAAPSPGAIRIAGLPDQPPLTDDVSDVRVGPISNVALSPGCHGLTARVVGEQGRAQIELREYGNNLGAAPYSTALLAGSASWDIGVAGFYLAGALDIRPLADDTLSLATDAGTRAAIAIHLI